jgi:hypothetical protein
VAQWFRSPFYKNQQSALVSPCYAFGGGISMLLELERKRTELMQELHAVGAAIKAYTKTIGQHHSSKVKKSPTAKLGKKRHMSAATKRKLSLAAKQRWAKINAKKG